MDTIRVGNFTSSEIVALTTNGKEKDSIGAPAYTYIEECNMERRLGRSITTEVDAKPTSWGKTIERRPFELLGLEYTLCSNVTIQHPEIDYWCGTPDATKNKEVVTDIKCPMTHKSFCQLLDPYKEKGKLIHEALTIEAVRENHRDGDKFFWQIVSNACLLEAKYGWTVRRGELIVYMPYKSELDAIRDLASSAGEAGEYAKWIYYATDEALPYLIDGGHYKNVNVIGFDILDRDKNFLINRVKHCGQFLNLVNA